MFLVILHVFVVVCFVLFVVDITVVGVFVVPVLLYVHVLLLVASFAIFSLPLLLSLYGQSSLAFGL